MICIYPADCTDFSSNGLGAVTPMSCTVTETLNGEWEQTLVHDIDESGKWTRLSEGCILRAPVPAAMAIVELDGITDSITLDTPLMEAYKDTTSMNSCVSGDFPTLLPGSNAISWTGNVTKIVIQPNWRYL